VGGEEESSEAVAAGLKSSPRPQALRRLLAGGTAGNSLLSTATGALLLVLLAALGVTIVAVHPLIDEHLFLGMLLIGPAAPEAGERRLPLHAVLRRQPPLPRTRRAGGRDACARAAGRVEHAQRVRERVVLLLAGPSSRGLWNPIHKYSFVVWLAVWWGHVVVHLPDLPKLWAARRRERERPGTTRAAVAAAARWRLPVRSSSAPCSRSSPSRCSQRGASS